MIQTCMEKIQRYIWIFFLLLFLSVPVLHIHAQALPGTSATITLASQPTYPGPNTQTTVSLVDYAVNTIGFEISWYVNGIQKGESHNERSITVTTGDVGTKTTIEARMLPEGGTPYSASLTLVPRIVDVVIEADTYIPTFYKGRALPSAESTIRAIAVVHDGTKKEPIAYSYKWILDGNIISNGALTGKNIVSIPTRRFQTGNLSLEVYDSSQTLIHKASTKVGITEPKLHFYEYSPLLGLSQKAIGSVVLLTGQNTTVYGEPYFINAKNLSSDTDLKWKIDGNDIASAEVQKNSLTLSRVGERGDSIIELALFTTTKLPQYVKQSFRVVFE